MRTLLLGTSCSGREEIEGIFTISGIHYNQVLKPTTEFVESNSTLSADPVLSLDMDSIRNMLDTYIDMNIIFTYRTIKDQIMELVGEGVVSSKELAQKYITKSIDVLEMLLAEYPDRIFVVVFWDLILNPKTSIGRLVKAFKIEYPVYKIIPKLPLDMRRSDLQKYGRELYPDIYTEITSFDFNLNEEV